MPNKPLAATEKLTMKQRRFIKGVAMGRPSSEAASMAGYSPHYGSYLMNQPVIKRAILTAMEKAGVSELLLAKKLRDGLEAMAPPRKDGGKQYPDQFVRKQFLDLIFRLRGDYAPIETVSSKQSVIQLVLGPGLRDALRDALPEDEADIIDAEIIEESNESTGSADERRLVEEEVSDRPILSLPGSSAA